MTVHFIGVLLSTIVFIAPVAASQDDLFDKMLSETVNSNNMVGLAAAVIRGGEVSFMRTYGVRDITSVDQVTPQTTFRIASLSKAFAATVAIQLDQKNKLSLNDRVIKSNNDFQLKSQAQTNSATLNHVLSHRLSLPPYAYDNLLEAGTEPNKILRAMKSVKPICKVGSCYAYQNVGFNMIASAIEVADEKTYVASVNERLFKPLEMVGASFGKDGLMSNDNWARSYTRRRTQAWRAVSVKQAYYDVPAAGGVNANIVDMSKWLVAQLGHRPNVLTPQTLEHLQTIQTATPRESRRVRYMSHVTQTHYGLGWRIYQYGGTKVVNHSGSVEGYGAQIAFLPDRDVGIVLLTNSKTRAFWRILPTFLDMELGLGKS